MVVSRVLCEKLVAQTRWAALDQAGLPVALYVEPREGGMVLGQRLEGVVRSAVPAAGGVFLEVPGSGDAFLRRKNSDRHLREGSRILVEVIAEPRAGKLARVRQVGASDSGGPVGAEAWLSRLLGGVDADLAEISPGAPIMQALFDEALADSVTLAGGGLLRIDHTRALMAADVDTAGRSERGPPPARALAVNRDAAIGLAREILRRGLGGLCVLDCVAPLGRAAGEEVRASFSRTWTALTTRPVKILSPSALGLMELSVDWWITPIRDHVYGAQGRLQDSAIALDGLRRLEYEASQQRMARLTLALPEAAFQWLGGQRRLMEERLAARYGARLSIIAHPKSDCEVFPEQ